MKLYFDFFNEKETKYIYMNETNNFLNINFSKFNLSVHLDDDLRLDYDNITDFFLIIEKDINGIYTLEKKISGNYNNSTKTIDYINCNFDDVVSNTASYKLHFQFNEGGVITYNGKDKPYFINLKSKCEDFKMEIYNSVMIEDYYEIQNVDINIPSITFKASIINNKNFNNYRYYYVFKNTESNKDIVVNYKTLSENFVVITEGISSEFFKDDVTYLHFYLKDTFDNVSYKVFKITTKQNTLTLFEILNTEVNIKPAEEISVFYNMRNIESVTPVVKVTNEQNITTTHVSKKVIGTYDKLKNIISFKLSDYFENDFNNSNLKLHFVLNKNEKNISNEMLVHIDSVPPIVNITNFENNYKLITTDEKVAEISGTIQDSNFFYLGNNRQKIELSNAKHYLILHSNNNNIQFVSFGEETKKYEFLKYSKYYIVETLSETFTIYDKNGEIVNQSEYTYVNDFVNLESKNIYIIFDKNKLSNYELNIIENQGGLKVKGSEFLTVVKKQEFKSFSDLYYLKIQIDKSANKPFSFDVGIDGFGYSFLPKINYSNISCNLNGKKEIISDFEYCNFIVIKSNSDLEISKFTDSKIIYNSKTITCGELTFTSISTKTGEYFSQNGEYMYFDENLNSFPFEEVYSKPKILDNKQHEIECLNYSVAKIDENLYSFSFNIKIEDGINNDKLQYFDISGNKTEVEFIVEKNTNKILIEIDELYNKNFDKFQVSENEYDLTTNKKTINVKFIIKNETLNNINNDAFIIVKSENVYKKQKILKELEQRVVYFEFSNLTETKENFKVFYNNDIKENIIFSIINKPSLILNVEPTFITGFNYYYLKYSTDKFSNIKLEYDNKNFICNLKNGMVEIIRTNNSIFLERINLKLIASDKQNLFGTIIKKISGTFYNSSIVQDYHIDNLYNNKIIDHQFDLKIKSYDKENIEYIKYYDPLEVDIFKRNKYAVYDKKTDFYIIKNIVTPITPSYFDISIKIKNEDLTVNKRLYEEDLISLYEEKNNLTVTYIKENEKLHIRIINKEKESLFYNSLEVYNNGELLKTFSNIEFTNQKNIIDFYFDLSLFFGVCDITVKLLNRFNKIAFIDTYLINFDYIVDDECYFENFEHFNVLYKSELNKIKFITNINDGNFYLKVKPIIQKEQIFNLSVGYNSLQLEPGQYLFEIYYQKNNYVKKMISYNIEVINDNFNYINYSKEYSKYLKVENIIFKKDINTKFEYLKPQLFHYCNSELIKIYEPIYHNEFIEFNINKQIGNNSFVYKDNKFKFEIEPYIKKSEFEIQNFEIYSIHTDNQSLFFSPNSSAITLDSLENLYFKTRNVDNLIIKTYRVRPEIPKNLIDDVENVLFKEFIPCKLEFYNGTTLYKTIDVRVEQSENIRIPFFNGSLKRKADRYDFIIKNNAKSILKKSYPMFINHKKKHFLFSYVKNLSMLSEKSNFLKLTYDEQDNYIRMLCIEYFNKFKNNDISELKKFIKNKMEEH